MIAVLFSLPVADIRLHGKQLPLSLPDGFIGRNRVAVDGEHQPPVDVGQLGKETVLDKIRVVPQIQHPTVSAVDSETVRAELHAVRGNGILEGVPAPAVTLRLIEKIVLRAVVVEIEQNAQLLGGVQWLQSGTERQKERRKLAFHTVEIAFGFVVIRLLHRDRQILLLRDTAGLLCVFGQHPVVFIAVTVQTVATKREQVLLLKSALTLSAVADRDLRHCPCVKGIEDGGISEEQFLLALPRSRGVVDVGETEGFRPQPPPDQRDPVLIKILHRNCLLDGCRNCIRFDCLFCPEKPHFQTSPSCFLWSPRYRSSRGIRTSERIHAAISLSAVMP